MMKNLRLSRLCLVLAVVFVLGIIGGASNASAADPVQILLNDANMTLTHTTIGDRNATYTTPNVQLGIDLPLHYKLNDGEWNILWNVGTFPDQGTPILTTGPLGNNAGDILTIGATGQGDSPLISGGIVAPASLTEISVSWNFLHLEGTFPNGGDPYTIEFSNVVTTLTVDGAGTISPPSLCQGDFSPSDGDVDGSDLAYLIAHIGELELSVFADNFGLENCLVQ